MLLAATMAGVGFGNAGCHLPHGMSYTVSGMVRDYRPEGYPEGMPIIPHGMSVALNAPAAFRFTGPANPERHLAAAKLMGVDVADAGPEDAGDILADAVIAVMKQIGVPNGLAAVGYGPDDLDALVDGTLPQHRVTKLSPRPATQDDFHRMFAQSLTLWLTAAALASAAVYRLATVRLVGLIGVKGVVPLIQYRTQNPKPFGGPDSLPPPSPREHPTVIPANAGIHPRQGAPPRKRKPHPNTTRSPRPRPFDTPQRSVGTLRASGHVASPRPNTTRSPRVAPLLHRRVSRGPRSVASWPFPSRVRLGLPS